MSSCHMFKLYAKFDRKWTISGSVIGDLAIISNYFQRRRTSELYSSEGVNQTAPNLRTELHHRYTKHETLVPNG